MENTMGSRIMARRKALGLTQEQLAEKLGVTAQAVSKWENDQSCPDISLLPRLAELFGTTTDALLGRETPAPAPEPEKPQRPVYDRGRVDGLAFAALVLLVGGVLLAAGMLDWDISFWSALWPSVLLVVGIRGLLDRFSFFSVGCALFGGYFLLHNLDVLSFEIDGELIFPIILLIFGGSILADVLLRPRKNPWPTPEQVSKNEFHIDGETFSYGVSFGEQNQTVTMSRLSYGQVSASFGECRLDLSGVETLCEGCTVNAQCNFGELTIAVPRRFFVQCDSSTAFANVSVQGSADPAPSGTLLLKANAKFGQINVQYI